MRPLPRRDRSLLGLLQGRQVDSHEVPAPYFERSFQHRVQFHEGLVQRLSLDTVMEGHTGCVNAIAWNQSGSLLVSGSDDQRVNVWDYGSRRLLHSIDSGHNQNIFCTQFMPETNDEVVVSGAGDGDARVHRMSRCTTKKRQNSPEDYDSETTRIFSCHFNRVKKLGVEAGNPHLLWSASEDGTLRQHDVRERSCSLSATSRCRSVLLDLRGAAKRTLGDAPRGAWALKSFAISPTRPHHLLVGGSDSFARLYDRRMLSVPTAVEYNSKAGPPPPCMCYFAPKHLADGGRQGLHLTHVAFGHDGREVLLSYSGEHVYLMDSDCRDETVVYQAGAFARQLAVTPPVSADVDWGAGRGGLPRRGHLAKPEETSTSYEALYQRCELLVSEAQETLLGTGGTRGCTCAIELVSEALESKGTLGVVGPGLRHAGLCVRAHAYVTRQWKNDAAMAVRDCNDAREIYGESVPAHHWMAEALAQLGHFEEAVGFAACARFLDPVDPSLAELTQRLTQRLQAARRYGEEPGGASSAEGGSKEEQLDRRRDGDEEEEDEESDLEVEVEFEDSPASPRGTVTAQAQFSGWPGVTVRLRHRPTGTPPRTPEPKEDREQTPPSVLAGPSVTPPPRPPRPADLAVDMRQRYVGHCNTGTDIKQASFLGSRGEFIASGSDDGRWFVWEKCTGRLVKMLTGDENVVNCVQSHPFDATVATSGIDDSIKLWTPRAYELSVVGGGVAGPEAADTVKVMGDNQSRMKRQRSGGFSMELLSRLRVREPREGPAVMECAPS